MIRIDILPDDVLLEIFDFHATVDMTSRYYDKRRTEAWQSLVHVCRRWRSIVFGSQRRLDLKLYCSPETPVKDTLDVWPALRLVIEGAPASPSGTDNIIAALEQSGRVRHVNLNLTSQESEQVMASMQVSFPELVDLRLMSYGKTPVIPDSFLGGSAPRLQLLVLSSISFPGLSKLLSSATHLAHLDLHRIPHSGYIPPQAIVAVISVLSSLEELHLGFESFQSRPNWESQTLPPPKRSILPALSRFSFKGTTKYLEEFMTHIDSPQLVHMHITFFNRIDFECPRLGQFIGYTPTLMAPDEAHVQFYHRTASVTLRSQTSKFHRGDLLIHISCREPDRQLLSIKQVCNSAFHTLPVEDLYIEHRCLRLFWKDDAIESALWLQLLLPFTVVKNLYLSNEFALGITDALKEHVGGRMTEVLPSLQNIFVEELQPSGSLQEIILQFVAAQHLFSDHPIAISVWDKD